MVKPPLEAPGRKTAAVNGEVVFGRAQRPGTFDDERLQDRGELRVLVEGRHLDAGDGAGQVAACVGFPQVRGEAAAAEGRVDLEDHGEDRVLDRVRPLPANPLAVGFGNAGAQVMQQDLKPFLLEGLGFVVGWPDLLVRRPNRDDLGVHRWRVRPAVAFARESRGVDMLAGFGCQAEVVALALIRVKRHPVLRAAALG
jgi:hypothetical protein